MAMPPNDRSPMGAPERTDEQNRSVGEATPERAQEAESPAKNVEAAARERQAAEQEIRNIAEAAWAREHAQHELSRAQELESEVER